MAVLFANNYNTRLATGALATDTTMMLVNPLPFTMTAKDSCYLTLVNYVNGAEVYREVVRVVATATNQITVERGASATEWAANTIVEMRLVAEYFNNDVMSAADIMELLESQQEAIASLGGASASFDSSTSVVLSEDPLAATELTWTTTTPTSNSNVLDLGVNSVIFKRKGNYSFLNNLTFARAGSNQPFAVTFTMYDADTLEVIGAAVKHLDMSNNTSTTVVFNALVAVDASVEAPVTMKVKAHASSTPGTVTLVEFSSIVISQSAVSDKVVSKDSDTGSAVLPAGTTAERTVDPVDGAIRLNTDLNRFEGYKSSNWSSLGGASGNGNDEVFYENSTTITTSYNISTGKNAMTAGPIAINEDVEVGVPVGSSWTIV